MCTKLTQCVRMEVVRKYIGDASRSSSVEESGRRYVGQKTEETTKRKSVGSLRGTSLYIWVGNTATDRETGEDADS